MKTESTNYDRRNFISTLMKIEHGKLEGYINDGLLASNAEPELFSHFISWNQIKGKVRDSKVAYPVIALRSTGKNEMDLAQNAVAHLMLLSPRDLVRAYKFSREMAKKPNSWTWELFEDATKKYLRVREEHNKWWDKTVLQHRKSMRDLYRIFRVKPSDRAKNILFEKKYPAGSIFAKVAGLKSMTPKEAASIILTEKIPFEVIVGSLSNIKDQNVLLALLEGMTGNQVVTNSKMLEKLGVKNNPVLNAAYQSALTRAAGDKRLNILKAGVAAETVTGDAQADLLNLQVQATRKQLGGIEGNWLILGDCSGSMSASMELAKRIAGFITERVTGKVWLIFFDTQPTAYEVTGKTFFQIEKATQHIRSGGGTAIGCGLDYMLQRNEEVDGIAIVSDGGDNWPSFGPAYKKYSEKFGKEPTVYYFDVDGERDVLSGQLPWMQKFNLRGGKVDYNSLPNIVETLRTNRYSLVDEILATPLLTLEGVFNAKSN